MLYNNRKEIPIFICTDNCSLFNTINSTDVTEKQLRIYIAVIKDTLQSFTCNVYWTPTEKQLANCLPNMVYQTNCYYLSLPTASCHKVIFVKLGFRQIAALIS